MPKLLMCPPDYFDIEYSINPWMDTAKKAADSKTEQWQQLKETFEGLGVDVALMEPQKGLPDLVYIDAGVLMDKTFIPSNFMYPERQPEREHFRAWFAEHGYEIVDLPDTFTFEGHGDTLWAGKRLYIGYGFRSTTEAAGEIERVLQERQSDVSVVPLQLMDERFYHLDTTFCPLNERQAMLYRGGLSNQALAVIEEQFEEIVEVSEADAMKFACNAVVLGKDIVIPAETDETCRKLNALGYTTHQVPMTEFMKGGGACKCLSMPL